MIKLHLGCGKRDFGPNWIHIDQADFPHIKYKSVTDLSQFENNSVDLIYACHLIAYFSREEIVMVLNEWKRVLKPGGILRLATPDFYTMVKLYLKSSDLVSLSDILGPLYGEMNIGDKKIYHKTTYDCNDISSLLHEIGFKNIDRYNFAETEHSKFDDHSKAHLPHNEKAIESQDFSGYLISLNIECKK